MSLTAKDVEEIMRLLEESSFDSLSLEIDGMKLHLQRGSAAPLNTRPAARAPTATESTPAAKAKDVPPPTESGLVEVAAPLLGVFYRAPRPGEPPFIEVGSKIENDTTIGIIEVMKLMNPVPAGVKGEVVEIHGRNGALVEYGEVLLRVRPEN